MCHLRVPIKGTGAFAIFGCRSQILLIVVAELKKLGLRPGLSILIGSPTPFGANGVVDFDASCRDRPGYFCVIFEIFCLYCFFGDFPLTFDDFYDDFRCLR